MAQEKSSLTTPKSRKKYMFIYAGEKPYLSDDFDNNYCCDTEVFRFDIVDGVIEIEVFDGSKWIAVDPKE